MKTLCISACLMWFTLAAELASPAMLPHGSLLLPVVCGVMYWSRSSTGLMLSGVFLLLDWIARPTYLPLCPMLLPFIAVMALAPSVHNDEYRTRSLSLRLPTPLHLPLLTLAAVVLHLVSSLTITQYLTPNSVLPLLGENLKSLAIIALPVSAVASLIIRLADEFGLRRSFSH